MLEMEPGQHDTEGHKRRVVGWPHEPGAVENLGLHTGLGGPYLVW